MYMPGDYLVEAVHDADKGLVEIAALHTHRPQQCAVRSPLDALFDAMAFHVTEFPSLILIRLPRLVLVRNAAGCSKLSQVIIYCQAITALLVDR